jgi:hypothetical protein
MKPAIAPTTRGNVSAALIHRRRVMSMSSGLGPSSIETVRGSNAIPQIGHEPGPIWITSGCIGHVYSTLAESVAVTLG